MSFGIPSPLQQFKIPLFEEAGIELWVKRDDLIHPTISGNKWRKLKFNLEKAKELGYKKILTFGGAFSNHIAAVGAIAEDTNMEFHAMIRGEELKENSNHTLEKAASNGLHLHFVERSNYKNWKRADNAASISKEWSDFYLIPEGGANEEGVKGCETICSEIDQSFDIICLSAGTGTTAAGILRSVEKTKLLIFPALKNASFLKEEILNWQTEPEMKKDQLELITEYHFGGFAKAPKELVQFARSIKKEFDLPLDYLYTAKAFFGLMEMIQLGRISRGSRIVFYHSGGLQGNFSLDEKY